ncbi:uncharacterized protein [Atheta coriaria]|uniref:uncharacterized protein n=1 Tax=Dalotia coriaria TaxID=877792 RepID=UPI0031F42141
MRFYMQNSTKQRVWCAVAECGALGSQRSFVPVVGWVSCVSRGSSSVYIVCLAGYHNNLGQRLFYQVVSSGRTECPRTSILSSDSGEQNVPGHQINVPGHQFFHQILANRMSQAINFFIRFW